MLDDLVVLQHRTADLRKRRELILQIQRHPARQQYYIHAPSSAYIAVWNPALKGYAPNLGYDYGGAVGGGMGGEVSSPLFITCRISGVLPVLLLTARSLG